MTLSVTWARLEQQLAALNAINAQPDGSCCRLALTPADAAGRDLVCGWMRELGLEVLVDQIGNIIGRQPGGEAPVMAGSHIDTVATGGRFDGAYGVLAALEVIRTLKDAGRSTARPLAVAVFTNEEGVRFQPDMMGSLVYAGGLPLQTALDSLDLAGVRLGDDLARYGYAGAVPTGSVIPHAFVELHIEQGPILEREGLALGAVENLQAISWREVVFRGSANHAGTTPMVGRHDAAYCAGRTISFVRELTERMGDDQVGTVGTLQLSPNLVNVIAREARLTIDLRNVDDDRLTTAEIEMETFLEDLARAQGVRVTCRQLARTAPVQFHPMVLSAVEAACRAAGHPPRRMTSGAGHDAQMMARICPAGMIFVPSLGGISHNPRENTRVEHLELGANVLLRTMLSLADS